jgi:hypothetical protein
VIRLVQWCARSGSAGRDPAPEGDGMDPRSRLRRPPVRGDGSARLETLVTVQIGIAVAVIAALLYSPAVGLLLGWDTVALLYIGWLAFVLLGRDAEQTARRATTTDPDRLATDVALLSAAVASLATVAVVLIGPHDGSVLGFVQVGRLRRGLGGGLLGDGARLVHAAVRRALLRSTGRWHRLRLDRTAHGPRFRLPRLHRRDDVPGVGHGSALDSAAQQLVPACPSCRPWAAARFLRDCTQAHRAPSVA